MAKKIKNFYRQADLSAYSFKQRTAIRLADFAFYALIGLIGKTLRFETEGLENYKKIYAAGKIPIYVLWHNRIFAGTYFLRDRKIVVITSQSFDGEYIARFIRRFGFGAARGSSTRGGVSALIEMIGAMRDNLPAALTIDGPKGPRYVAKPGACLLAKKTQNPLLPFSLEVEKFWEIKSWDKLQIPKPFSRARAFYGKPIDVSGNANENEIEDKRLELQKSLDELVALGKQWRDGKN